MPQKTESITVAGNDAAELQAKAYGALEKLNWSAKYAGENIIVAYTPKKWNKYADEIKIDTSSNQLTITSKMVHGESFDMGGRNKKHIAEFLAAFEQVRGSATDIRVNEWKEKIAALQAETIKTAEIEIKQAEEVDKVMNLSSGTKYVTYAIMLINVVIFILTVVNGVDFMTPRAFDLLPWGANYPPLTYSGEWWRLFTSTFLHFGIIHLALNMYALYSIGIFLEPMMGKLRYTAAYICSGLLASAISLYWHKDGNIVSAGASGAIFGMYGVFLALLTTKLIPKTIRGAQLQSILIFVGYNIFYGFRPNSGIDNAAHMGGLLSGMVIGYIFYPTLKTGASAKKIQIATGIIVLLTVLTIFLSLQGQQDDNKLFNLRYTEFALAEEKAIDSYKKENATIEDYDDVIIPAWQEASQSIEKMSEYKLNKANAYTREKLEEYVRLRKDEARLRRKALKNDTNEYNDQIKEIVESINAIIEDLNSKDAK